MLTDNEKQKKELKVFGYSFSAGMAILFTVSMLNDFSIIIKILSACLSLFHLSAVIINYKILKTTHGIVGFLGKIIGNTLVTLLFTIIYYFLFTPFAFVLRIFRKDYIRKISLKPGWIDIDPAKNDPKRIEKLY